MGYDDMFQKIFGQTSDYTITDDMWEEACNKFHFNDNMVMDDINYLLLLKQYYLKSFYKWCVVVGSIDMKNKGKWVAITTDKIPTQIFETKKEAEEFGVSNMCHPMCFVCFQIGLDCDFPLQKNLIIKMRKKNNEFFIMFILHYIFILFYFIIWSVNMIIK